MNCEMEQQDDETNEYFIKLLDDDVSMQNEIDRQTNRIEEQITSVKNKLKKEIKNGNKSNL